MFAFRTENFGTSPPPPISCAAIAKSTGQPCLNTVGLRGRKLQNNTSVCAVHSKECHDEHDTYSTVCKNVWLSKTDLKAILETVNLEETRYICSQIEKCRELRLQFIKNCFSGMADSSHKGAIIKMTELSTICHQKIFELEGGLPRQSRRRRK
jgi:hypothetical protein